jgi:hypothetical protein
LVFSPKTNRKNLPVPNLLAPNWAKYAFLDKTVQLSGTGDRWLYIVRSAGILVAATARARCFASCTSQTAALVQLLALQLLATI